MVRTQTVDQLLVGQKALAAAAVQSCIFAEVDVALVLSEDAAVESADDAAEKSQEVRRDEPHD